ncbi:MAG TPA: signal peptidase I, partial [Actinomycetota bacterium]|nr:signal peptidase I [Actinomycetota bacterium]
MTASRRPRLLRAAAAWMLIGLGVGVALAARGPALFGRVSLTVMSGSMEPAIGTGDLIVEERISPLQVRVGDVVTFNDPSDPTRLVTHRVRMVDVEGNAVNVTTRGDANTASESWSAPVDGEVGRVLYRMPALGYLVHWTATKAGRLALMVIP